MRKRLNRISEIITLLRGDRAVTVSEIAEALRVHRRTIFRDFHMLREMGVEVQYDSRSGRYWYESDGPVILPEADLSRLKAAGMDNGQRPASPPLEGEGTDDASANSEDPQLDAIACVKSAIVEFGWVLMRRRADSDRGFSKAIPWELSLTHFGWQLCFAIASQKMLNQWLSLKTLETRNQFRNSVAFKSLVAPLETLIIRRSSQDP